MKHLLAICVALSILAVSAPLSAEDIATSAERIKTLEAKVDALNAKVALLLLRLQQSENVNPSPTPATGSAPVVSLTAPPPASSPDVPLFVQKEDRIPVVAEAPLDHSPESQYKTAFQLINEGKYDEASEKFRDFVAAHGSHKLAALAHYWLGEIHYEKKELQKAHDAFMASYQSDPNSEKSPESLLKVTLVLKEMQLPQQACVALGILKRDYSESQAATRAKANADLAQLSCDATTATESVN